MGIIPRNANIKNAYLLKLIGKYPHKENGQITGEYSKQYDQSKYQFFLDAPFEIHNACCDVMKKKPIKAYSKETNRVPIIATMADESRLRTSNWLKHGCNAFELKTPMSQPISFWTEQDILKYIKDKNLPICSVYGDIVSYYKDEMEGQIGFDDLGLTDREPKLKTTGCNRTGCMFCGFGCHLEKEGEGRFERMKVTHPNQYKWIMKPQSEGGLGYKEIIDWINEHGDLNIRY